MNKKLVAVAVAGVLGIPLAAQAQTANVTLYGRLNVDVEVINGRQPEGSPAANSNPDATRVSSNSSRFGMRGVESLGNGLNAIFQIESSINGDSNSGNLGGRETFVGFQGDWGTFKLGNFLNITDDMHGIFGNAPTYLTSILSTATIWGLDNLSRAQGGFDTRNQNSIRYDSPSYNGLTFSGMLSLQDNSGGVQDLAGQGRHAYAANVGTIYNNGPIQVGLNYDSNNKVRGPGLNDHEYTVTGGYDFGPVRIGLVYEYKKWDVAAGGDINNDMYGISGTIPAGPGKIYAYWGHISNGKGSAADGSTLGVASGPVKGPDTSADQWELTYTYPLSKRTQVYGGYVKYNNKQNATYTFNINNYTVAPGGDPGGLVLGMIHFF